MKKKPIYVIAFVCSLVCSMLSAEQLKSVSFDKVSLEDTFWKDRMKLQKKVLVPIAFDRTADGYNNLLRAGKILRGEKSKPSGTCRFDTSDLYKVMEGASYLLKLERDEKLEAKIDHIATLINSAMEEDDYLYPPITGKGLTTYKRYEDILHNHELYNVGHLYEAAIAYYLATGKRNLLDIAERSANHVNKVFFVGGNKKYNDGKPINKAPGHQEIELALVKMYMVTGKKLYLDMAKKFLDIRGITFNSQSSIGTATDKRHYISSYAQQHLPVREQTKAVGHSVRATYMYSAMADVGALIGDDALRSALRKIWIDIVDKKMHITGGLGAIKGIEGFGPDYDLPNETAYDETCAGIGNLLFNYRMFLLEQDAKYVDVAEVALFNNILTGVSFSGDKFFYDNPLESYGDKQRSHWFGCACCPTNLARIIPQISGMMYANNSNEIFCGFYTSNSTTISLKNGDVYLKQTSNYPYDENVLIEVTPKNKNQKFTLNMRVPTWAIGEKFVPGALYYYANKSENNKWSISVNGNILKDVKLEKGFVKINRVWEKGDVIKLHLPKKVRFNKAIKEVKADKGRVAITYGPLVYCAESVDNVTSANLLIVSDFNQNTDVHICKNGILKGIELIRLQNANYITKDKIMKKCELNLIPYYAWNNRGVHSMNIWFADSFKSLLENPDINKIINNYEFVKKITATFTNQNDCLNATISNVNPKSSSDKTLKRWTSYNKKTPQSLTYEFKKNLPISEVNVYWYDDNNEVRVPKTWNIEYLDESNKWQKYPLYLTDSYSVLKDQYNVVRTAEKSINTKALRINIKPQDNSSVGILKVQFK